MKYRRLFLLVEGPDDMMFFSTIVKPKFETKYSLVEVRPHAGLKREKIRNFLRAIALMNADYLYVADIDSAPCVTAKKEEVQNKIGNINNDRIVVVIKEIESWYLAGLDTGKSKNLRISSFSTTDDITKERFNTLMPKEFDSRIDFMLEILKFFSVDIAKQKNKSFRYFLDKHNC